MRFAISNQIGHSFGRDILMVRKEDHEVVGEPIKQATSFSSTIGNDKNSIPRRQVSGKNKYSGLVS